MKLDRREQLNSEAFVAEHLAAGCPVIVADAVSRWGGPDRAISEGVFLQAFAEAEVQVYDDLFNLICVCPLHEYIGQYWHAAPRRDVPYVRWYAKFHDTEFEWADAAFERIATYWSMPYFLPRSGYELPRCEAPHTLDPARDAFPAKGIFLSAAGARTRLHSDPWCSDAVLCQVSGRKKVVLYSPGAAPFLSREGELIDIDAPDLQHFPAFPRCSPQFEDVLEPREVLYIPAGWFHHVTTLTSSISLTWNFVHGVHAARFKQYREGLLSSFDRGVLEYFDAIARFRSG
jgi:hypothetical protein